MEAAEEAIRTAVHRAERMAGENVRSVFVGTSGGAPSSSFADVEVGIGGREVAERDIQRAFDQLQISDEGQERDIVHAVPIDYALDGSTGITDPRGMYGDNLQVRLHMVSVAHGSLRNLLSCVSRCDLQVAAPVAAAYASGLACLVSDEIDLGATCIDIGGGTTKLAILRRRQSDVDRDAPHRRGSRHQRHCARAVHADRQRGAHEAASREPGGRFGGPKREHRGAGDRT